MQMRTGEMRAWSGLSRKRQTAETKDQHTLSMGSIRSPTETHTKKTIYEYMKQFAKHCHLVISQTNAWKD